jgi:hypothetical protein
MVLSEQCNGHWTPESTVGAGWKIETEYHDATAVIFEPVYRSPGFRH